MGASGVGIFDDDVACDVRIALYDRFRAGESSESASDAVLEDFSDAIEDEEDGPVVILALAAAQWEAGRLDSRIKKRALRIIERGADFRWDVDEYREQRIAVLNDLAAMLNRVAPPPKPINELEW